MNLDDRLYKDKKKQDEIKRNLPMDEDEETYMYAVKKPEAFLNESTGVFDIKMQTGINTAKSVFDKSIFRTGN